MKRFFKALSSANGVCESELTAELKETARILHSCKAISRHKNRLYLNNGFLVGRIDIAANGTGFLETFDGGADLIVEPKDLNASRIGDFVLARKTASKKARPHAKVVAILKLAHASTLVYTKKFGTNILGVNLANGIAMTLNASQKSLKALPTGTVLCIDNAKDEIVEVLGTLDAPAIDEKISLALYDKREAFSTTSLDEAASFGTQIYPEADRTDLRALEFCTIDPFDAKDFDDALFFDEKNREIYVAIADVSYYVTAFSALDKEAKFRGFSIYFPHKSVPMLPRALSENLCSLVPHEDRLAFVFRIKLDENLEIQNADLFEAVINSKRRYTYDEVDSVLENKQKGEISWLNSLFSLTQNLRKKRLEKGFDFTSLELDITLENDRIVKTKFERQTPSHSLVEECMLLANISAAKRLKNGVFRNHAEPDLKKIHTLLDDLLCVGIDLAYKSDLHGLVSEIQQKAEKLNLREAVDKMIIKAQKRAEYAPFSFGHFGLGFERYAHFTSPIRRYSDLVLHRLLKADIKGDSKLFGYYATGLEALCERLNVLEREADKVAWDFASRKFARWAQGHLGEVFACVVEENEPFCVARVVGGAGASEVAGECEATDVVGAKVVLENFCGELLLRVGVRLTNADVVTGKIYGKVVRSYGICDY